MDMSKHSTLCGVVLAFFLGSVTCEAQYAYGEPAGAAYTSPAPAYKLERPTRTHHISKSDISTEHFRHHRQLSSNYSGQFIQLTISDRPLPRTYELFRQFGKVYYDQLEDGRYAYGLKVEFTNKKAMKKFLDQVVRPRAKDACLVSYKKGFRKT